MESLIKGVITMKVKILVVLILFLFFGTSVSFAGVGSAISLHNNEIDSKTLFSIHELNNIITESIKNNDPSIMLNLFMDEVKNQPGIDVNIKSLYSQLNPLFNNTNFKVENDYFVTIKSFGGFNPTIFSETDERFTIAIEGKSDQMFISLLNSNNGFTDYMLTIIYAKIKNEWKLYRFDVGVCKTAGKSAINWFNEAKQFYEKGYLIPAVLRLKVLHESLRPAPFIQYEKESEISSFANQILTTFNQKYQFPIRLTNLKTSPEIYSILPQFVKNELLTAVYYKSSIPLNNPADLQKEVEAMTPELELMFPGITKDVAYITYKAFSEAPTDPKKQYENYGLVVEINKISSSQK